MNFRTIFSVLFACFAVSSFAHDEGHGPKILDQPKHGGITMPVIEKAESSKGASAKLIFKSELVRAADGTFSIYFYDEKMVPLPVGKFGPNAKAMVGPMRKNRKWKSEEISLEFNGQAFAGKLPEIKAKPYYIDVTVMDASRALLTAFENLD